MENSHVMNLLREFLTDEELIVRPAELESYASTSGLYKNTPAFVIRPAQRNKVAKVLKFANQEGFSVYPISCGNNWGYGSRNPCGPGQVVLDLSQLNRIVEYNRDLAYVVVEPGVTQKQLSDFLISNGDEFIFDVTGAGPDASVLGNTVERGFGHGIYANHFETSCGYEVVLANGESISTGFACFDESKVSYAYKYGIGPSLDGLFTQSNLGVITQMGMWLSKKESNPCVFAVQVAGDDDVITALKIFGALKSSGSLHSAIHFGNDLRVISSREAYPFHNGAGGQALSSEALAKLRERHSLFKWNCLGILGGDARTRSATKRILRSALKNIGHLHFLDQRTLRVLKKTLPLLHVFPFARSVSNRLAHIEPVFNIINGVPDSQPIYGVQWRNPHATFEGTIDPNLSGHVWISPLVPNESTSLRLFLSTVSELYAKHDLDPLISLTILNVRTICAVLSVNYNKEDTGEACRARDCYEELLDACFQLGFIPYRLGVGSMKYLKKRSSAYSDLIEQIKESLDPNRVLAPGRYTDV